MPENQKLTGNQELSRIGSEEYFNGYSRFSVSEIQNLNAVFIQYIELTRFNYQSGAPQSTRIPHRRFKNKCSTLLHLAHSFGRIINTEFSGKYQYFPSITHEQTLYLKCIVGTIPIRLHLQCESGSIIKCIYDVTSRKKEPSWIRAKSAISV